MKPEELDWRRVKQLTLWSYEDLIAKLQEALAYPFVQRLYDHSLPEAQVFARAVRRGYLNDRGDSTAFIDRICESLAALQACEVSSYAALLSQIDSREKCAEFLDRTGFDFAALIEVLSYLLRWVFPFKFPLRELIDVENPAELSALHALKKQRLFSNLDLLESASSLNGRVALAGEAQLPLGFLTSLVHKADISRLAFVRGKTVRHLCGGGYATLAQLAFADLPEMERRMDAYYHTLGKSLSDFKAVIPLAWMVGGAQILPPLVEG